MKRGATTPWLAAALSVAAVLPGALGVSFLIVSAPKDSKVGYVAVPDSGLRKVKGPDTLIDEGLHTPTGLAVDQRRKRLFIADPGGQRVLSAGLTVNGEELRVSGAPKTIANGVAAEWVAVDGVGNVFFSNEPGGQIMRVSAEKVLRGNTDAEVIYDATAVAAVSAPGGVAVDNFYVHWVNKQTGTSSGSVVRGAEAPLVKGVDDGVSVLATNVESAYGICLAMNNLYYTDGGASLYGVKKSGGAFAVVSGTHQELRGCAWDGDGTVYVADKGEGAVFSFAGNVETLGSMPLTKVADFEDASGVAVLSRSASAPGLLLALGAALGAAGRHAF